MCGGGDDECSMCGGRDGECRCVWVCVGKGIGVKCACVKIELEGVVPCALTRLFVVVGFDAADIGWFLGHKDRHQLSQTGLELRPSLGE